MEMEGDNHVKHCEGSYYNWSAMDEVEQCRIKVICALIDYIY